MSAAFTPGPWEVIASERPDTGTKWLEIVDSDNGSIIGEIFNDEAEDEPFLTHEIAKANARLIAAAPKMYEALEWIAGIAVVNFEQDGKLRSQGARTLKRIADKAEAALAKARREA